MTRRTPGTGSIWYTAPHWLASVRVNGKSIRRKRRSREDAEDALAELLDKHSADLGYYYHMPRAYYFRDRPQVDPVRDPVGQRLRFSILRRDGFRCRYCGVTAQSTMLAVDHVQSVADGGTSDPENLVTACQPCNAGKAGQSLSAGERLTFGVAG